MAVDYPGTIPDLLTRFGINPLDFTSYTDLLRELQALFNAAGTNPAGGGGSIDGRLDALEAAAPALAVSTADSTAIANTTTETAFSTGSVTIPANSAVIGRTYRVTASGKVSTMAGTPGGLVLNLRWGNVNTDPLLVNLGSAVGMNASQTNASFFLTNLVTIRSVGASGTANGNGMGVNMALSPPALGDFVVGVVTINTTVAKSLTLFAKFATANAANTITLENFVVERVN